MEQVERAPTDEEIRAIIINWRYKILDFGRQPLTTMCLDLLHVGFAQPISAYWFSCRDNKFWWFFPAAKGTIGPKFCQSKGIKYAFDNWRPSWVGWIYSNAITLDGTGTVFPPKFGKAVASRVKLALIIFWQRNFHLRTSTVIQSAVNRQRLWSI